MNIQKIDNLFFSTSPYIKKSFELPKSYPDFLLVAGLYNYYRKEYVEIKPFYKTLVWFMQDN